MTKIVLLCRFLTGMILLVGCNVSLTRDPTLLSTYVEVPYSDLVLDTLDQDILADLGIPGCSLKDLRPFGWKTVDSGLVDIRTSEDYSNQIESLYQEGYLDYQQTREEYPNKYSFIPIISLEEFLETCKVFPDVDFSRNSLLGFQASGTGCSVTFDKHVYRDDQNKAILYELTVIEEGTCEKDVNNRNLILLRRIPSDYSVDFINTNQIN